MKWLLRRFLFLGLVTVVLGTAFLPERTGHLLDGIAKPEEVMWAAIIVATALLIWRAVQRGRAMIRDLYDAD